MELQCPLLSETAKKQTFISHEEDQRHQYAKVKFLKVHSDWHCVLGEAVAPIKFAADFGMDSITSEDDLRLYMRQAGTSFRSLDG